MSDCGILITGECEVAVLSSRPGVYCCVGCKLLLMFDVLKTGESEVAVLSSRPGACCCVVLLLMSDLLKTGESGEDCKLIVAVDSDARILTIVHHHFGVVWPWHGVVCMSASGLYSRRTAL